MSDPHAAPIWLLVVGLCFLAAGLMFIGMYAGWHDAVDPVARAHREERQR